MKRVITGLLCLGLASFAGATDVGLGFAQSSGTTEIAVPIHLNERWMFEGALSDSREHATYDYQDLQGSSAVRRTERYSYSGLSLGAYYKKPLTSQVQMYSGPRIAWGRGRSESSSNGFNTSYVSRGYGVGAVLGVEYYPVKAVSIGGECGANYSLATQDASSSGSGVSVGRSHGLRTFSTIKIRFYF